MSYFGVSTRNGVGLGLGTVPSLTNTPLGYRLAPSLDLSFAGSDALSPAITFSRTTNATLTNSAGLVANAPMNLLTFSEQFDNAAWGKRNVTVTANTLVSPDGTGNADKLIATTTNALHIIEASAASLTAGSLYTASVYAKKGETSFFQITFSSAAIPRKVNFDLNAGVTGTVDAGMTASIINVGNGWYRCIATGTSDATGSYRAVFGLIASATAARFEAFAGDGTSGLFLWGAQLELGSTATTYNPTTVKNLLGFTEHFDNAAWTKSNATISATKVDDIYGQPFAQKLVEDTANATHAITQSASKGAVVGTYAFSAYVKDGGRSKVRLLVRGATTAGSGAYVDSSLEGSVIGTAPTTFGSGWTAGNFASQDMGNGWYRVSLTATTSTETLVVCTVQLLDSSFAPIYTGDGTSGIYIFGAQLSDSASVDPYVYNPVAAPSSVAYYGPRFDYDPVTLAPKGLLIEEQRSNLVLNSATLATQNVTVAAVAHTLSFYGTGTVTLSGVSTAGPLVGTGSYPNRVTLTFTPTAGTLTLTVTGSVTMAQLEAGAFATSYIPTVASQVTRAADSASMIGNNFARWYNQTEGTFMVQGDTAKPTSLVASAQFMTVSDGTVNNNHRIRYITAGIDAVTVVGGAIQVDTNEVGYAANVSAKVAYAYQVNDYGFTVNGGTVQTITSATVPVVNSLQLGGFVANATPLNGHLQRFAYYNRRLSNTEEQGITS